MSSLRPGIATAAQILAAVLGTCCVNRVQVATTTPVRDAELGDELNPGASLRMAELWYSSGDTIVRAEVSPLNGSIVRMVGSPIVGLASGQTAITMLNDGSLLMLRLHVPSRTSTYYHLRNPPRDGSTARPTVIGVMPDSIMIEALYTDCVGRLFVMDTGVDVSSAVGNRLLLITGDYLRGDFTFKVVSDLSASVPDIDDMGPGIDSAGRIRDNPGFAIDSGNVYLFDYTSGANTKIGMGGTFGIHALGDALFSDHVSRLYLLSESAAIFTIDPVSHVVSEALATGPAVKGDTPGHSGLAGPMVDCSTTFIVP